MVTMGLIRYMTGVAAILDMQISQFWNSTRAIYQRVFKKKLRGLDEYWRQVSVYFDLEYAN